MISTDNDDLYHILTLENVASWQIPSMKSNGNSTINARIPSLQRGAVWEPQQIEMLWDSIMRGFPIGSIVVSKKIDTQNDKRLITSVNDPESSGETTHHILDGQQRCNAITWGFVDPWNENLSDDVVLWLDLKPGDRLKKSVRKYLFRVTTKAHPWGFHHGDQAGNLSSGDIAAFMVEIIKLHQKSEMWPAKFHTELINKDQENKIRRPSARLALPYDSGFPVPVSLLLKHFKNKCMDLDNLAKEPIMKVVMDWHNIDNLSSFEAGLNHIELGLEMVSHARLVALQVPKLIDGIDDIEQIFQRLNRQGTPLDNEELAYCLIKAHWPEIENVMRQLDGNLHHATEARLISLGVRVALTYENDGKIAPEPSVERIRNIFRNDFDKNKSVKDKDAQDRIKDFFDTDKFQKSLNWIDHNFVYNKERCDYGLPKYLRSSLAWYSRDVYAWLMWLAGSYNYEPPNQNETRKIIGLALTIHWFGEDKAKAIDVLISKASLLDMPIEDLNADKNLPSILIPIKPVNLDDDLQLCENSPKQQLQHWTNFWDGVVNRNKQGEKYPDSESENRRTKGLFISKLRQQTELLIYAQREYIESVFEGFDPSNKLMWKRHNRPWDYDHILPSNKIGGTGKKKLDFTDICKAWQQSIGNLIAVDFSFNRSAQDQKNASEKYADRNEIKGFLDEIGAFDIDHDSTGDEEYSRKFVLAAKDRLVTIYREWYDTLKIGQSK